MTTQQQRSNRPCYQDARSHSGSSESFEWYSLGADRADLLRPRAGRMVVSIWPWLMRLRSHSFLGFEQVGVVVKELLYFILHAQYFCPLFFYSVTGNRPTP